MLNQNALVALAALVSAADAGSSLGQFVMYTPGGDDTSVQRIDPIITPGSLSQHVHQVFGAQALDDTLSYDSLQNSACTTVADASDHGNAFDNSIYWHPALYMESNDNTGYVRVPTNGHKLYYKDAGSTEDTKADPFEFPHGFRMVAGNPFIRQAPQEQYLQNITQWICHGTGGMNQGTDGGFPTGVGDCPEVDGFNGAIHFPHCWNGADYDPANPSAHVVYPDGNIQDGKCPSTHPTRLPHIFMENTFDIHKVIDKVKANTFVLAMGDNTGYGWHADFFNGWKDGAIETILKSCPPNEYGNEDVGVCTAFQGRSTPASECKLPVKYAENVDTPGQALPGCNPISDVNPAPIMAIAALGISTNQCNAASEGDNPVQSIVNGVSSVASAATSILGNLLVATQSTAALTTMATVQTSSSAAANYAAAAAPSSAASSATMASAQSSSSPKSMSCPDANGTTYTSNGASFEIECGINHHAGDMGMKHASSLSACIDMCASTSGCVDVSLSGVACYMKKTLGEAEPQHGLSGAKLIAAGSAPSATSEAAPTMTSAVVEAKKVDAHGDVVYVTEVVTVTADAAASPVAKRHVHDHRGEHMKGVRFHVGNRHF